MAFGMARDFECPVPGVLGNAAGLVSGHDCGVSNHPRRKGKKEIRAVGGFRYGNPGYPIRSRGAHVGRSAFLSKIIAEGC